MSQRRPMRPKSRDEFEIAIICALTIEANAVLALFDHHWDTDEDGQPFGKDNRDPNAYSNGVIGQHNVVIAHLPGAGKVAAGNIASSCILSYPKITLALVVGICGGVPFYGKMKEEILLGDVIISTGVVQYDLGWRFPDKFREKDTLDDSLGRPNLELRSLFRKLQTDIHQERLQIATQNYLQQAYKGGNMVAGRPEGIHDNLFPSNYPHKHQDPSACTICAAWVVKSDPICKVAQGSTCRDLKCDLQQRVLRNRLGEIKNEDNKEHAGSNSETPFPMIHFGTFASGDSVIKSGEYRDQLAASKNAIGFEMEGAGVWDVFPCVVIKGVSDYADSHKNDDWHKFAAASAAACTKAFLKHWDSTKQQTRLEIERQKLRDTVINSLRFPEINERKNDLAPPASTTFQWVLRTGYKDSATQSGASDHEEEGPDQDGRTAKDQDQAARPREGLLEIPDRIQEQDSTGIFQLANDRSQSSDDSMSDYDDYDEEYSDSNDDGYEDDDDLIKFSNANIKWDAFTDWLASDKPIYWISGNPGSGKSTLMRYLSENRKTSKYLAEWQQGAVILSHFFWKPGTQMQRSFKGLLCSLLCELLSKNPNAVQTVHNMVTNAQRLSTADWNQEELKTILLEYCKLSSQPMCVFVDGLDEASPGQDVSNTLQFLKSLTSSNDNVKICVSSRPERLFRLHFDTCPSLRMHELTLFDIARYSQNVLVESTLIKPRGRKISDLARQIADLSDGIFLWAVLVTQSLIRGINNGDSSDQTWKRLCSMPPDLMDLYHDILSRSAPDYQFYQKDISLILNMLFVAAPWESNHRRWPITVFMLTMATNPDLLARYVDRGKKIQEQKLERKVQSMKNTLESALAGLVQVKYSPPFDLFDNRTTAWVSFPHRSAKDFLFDTEQGRNLWQPCDTPQEELLARYFKSLIADARLFSEQPKSKFCWGVDIRDLLSDMFEWEEKHSCPQYIIASFLELARLCFHRGHLQHRSRRSVELKPRYAGDQFLLHVGYGGKLCYIRRLLEEHEAATPEGMYCLLFNLCNSVTIDIRVMRLIEYILEQGYSANWSTVNTPTTGLQLVASSWFAFLVNLLDRPQSFFPYKPEAERGRLISDALQMFLKSGASLESIFPIVVRFLAYGGPSHVVLANSVTFPPEALGEMYMLLEVNANAVIDLMKRTSSFAQLAHTAVVQPDCLAAGSYMKVLAFNCGRRLSLSTIQEFSNTLVVQEFSNMLVRTILVLLYPSPPDSIRDIRWLFWNNMEKLGFFLPQAEEGYCWRGILLRVMDNWMKHS